MQALKAVWMARTLLPSVAMVWVLDRAALVTEPLTRVLGTAVVRVVYLRVVRQQPWQAIDVVLCVHHSAVTWVVAVGWDTLRLGVASALQDRDLALMGLATYWVWATWCWHFGRESAWTGAVDMQLLSMAALWTVAVSCAGAGAVSGVSTWVPHVLLGGVISVFVRCCECAWGRVAAVRATAVIVAHVVLVVASVGAGGYDAAAAAALPPQSLMVLGTCAASGALLAWVARHLPGDLSALVRGACVYLCAKLLGL